MQEVVPEGVNGERDMRGSCPKDLLVYCPGWNGRHTESSLRSTIFSNVSPTAVFHLHRNSLSGKGSSFANVNTGIE